MPDADPVLRADQQDAIVSANKSRAEAADSLLRGIWEHLRYAWPNFTYHWHTPKVCHKCWHRMERKRMSIAEYQCRRCGTERIHGEYISYRIDLR